jgi:hypothetical protein
MHCMTQTGQDDSYNGSTLLTTSLLRSSPPSHSSRASCSSS